MRRFLLRLMVFLLVALVGYAALIAGVIALGHRALAACHVGPDVTAVIVGDSHTMWSIDDSHIAGLRNISLNAEGYRYTHAKLVHLLNTEPQVEHVYLAVSYHNFSGYFDDYIYGDAFKFFAYRYLPVMDWSDYAKLAHENWRGLPALTQYVVTLGFVPGLKARCELYGSFPEVHQDEVFDPGSVRKRIESQFYRGGTLIPESATNVAYLQRIVDLCRQRSVRLTIVTTPMHAAYVRGVPEEYRRMLSAFVADNHLEFYDFPELTLPDSAFLPDGDHLNHDGAMRTTEEFARYHESH